MRKVRTLGYSLRTDTHARIERVSSQINRTKSQTLDRILSNLTDKTLLYLAMQTPPETGNGVMNEQTEQNSRNAE